MSWLWAHLIVLPILLPLVTAAVLLLLRERRRRLESILNLAATLAGLIGAVALLRRVNHGSGDPSVYLAANWQAPFGIVLIADRLSALLLVLVGVVGLCAALYAEASWARASAHFRPLFQIQLMGVNGAFLTGDLFNLFVFFEVTLAASYGLQLHGSGWPRVRSGLHYIAVNLLASSLFLIGLSVLYGVLGTLSMADIAQKIALVPERDRGLLHAGASILALAFLIKAAIWPLNAWLVPAYSSASAPVAALFTPMTKLGVYTLLRSWTLFFSSDAGPSAHFGGSALLYAGLATLLFGTLGLLGSVSAGRIASFSILVSSGTLLAAIAVGASPVTSAALFYLLSATLGGSALFLLVELLERTGSNGRPRLRDVDLLPGEDTNLDDQELPLVARSFPISTALLGLMFMTSAVLVAGLPPLSGFLAKFSILTSLLSMDRAEASGAAMAPATWLLLALLLLSSLATTVSLSRAGIRRFWLASGRFVPRLQRLEAASVLVLLSACVALTLWAEPVLRYTTAAAEDLYAPRRYIDTVLSAQAAPEPASATLQPERSP
ncbi:MAG TPA: monovalent cation/H+ antiporter subunit D [Polyangiaceae bacterium]|nr:monovalent cation/H+ antiporter subunit D [Polyangiaceae bacterium]